jgi:hypothetical protein
VLSDSLIELSSNRSPEENLGKPIPDVYGDFTSTDITTSLIYEDFSPAPSIMIDEPNKQFAFAGHAVHTFATSHTIFGTTPQNSFMWDAGVGVFAIFTTIISYSAPDASVITQTFGTAQSSLRYFYQPKSKGVLTDADITDHQKAVDKSSTNNTTMTIATKPDLYFRTSKTPSNIISENVTSPFGWISLGTVDLNFLGTMKYKKDGGALTGATTFANTDSDTNVNFTLATDTPSEYTKYQFGIAGGGADTAQIKNIVISFDGVVNNLTEQRDADTFIEFPGEIIYTSFNGQVFRKPSFRVRVGAGSPSTKSAPPD